MSEVVVSLFHVRDERTVQSRIKEAVEDYSRTYKTEDSQVKLLYESGGKPYLESRAVELSISHSGELWGCALSKEPVGLDIQLIREKGVCSVWGQNLGHHRRTARRQMQAHFRRLLSH